MISHEIPPIYEKLHALFGVEWDKGIIIAYGDKIHSKEPISDDLMVHERVHLFQQYGQVEYWWYQYINDPKFRLEQEVQAYREQLKFGKRFLKDRNQINEYIHNMAKEMSSSTYGNMCTFSEALELLNA